MGRKKTLNGSTSKRPFLPFCYYCDREYDDEKVLIQHQKFKHFKCSLCNRKPDTATGLVVHMLQVHKESLDKVPHALGDRENPNINISGMQGVPTAAIIKRAKGTDLEDLILAGEVYKHPLFKDQKHSYTPSSEDTANVLHFPGGLPVIGAPKT